LGIGSVISLCRSGDVIPHILKVIKPADEAKMPDVPYKWNNTKVDIMLQDKDNDRIVRIKNMTGFFKELSVDGLGSGNVERIYDAGFDTIQKMVFMTKDDLLGVEGFKDKMATKVFEGINNKVRDANLVQLLSASNIFGRGFGDKKLTPIFKEIPDILTLDESEYYKLNAIKGMAKKTVDAFIAGIPKAVAFVNSIGQEQKILDGASAGASAGGAGGAGAGAAGAGGAEHPLNNKKIVITGFRDKDLEATIKSFGGIMASSVSSKTDFVIVKDLNENTGKANEARDKNVELITVESFKTKYLNN
jgi:NAD-dependent DNA ligase